MLLVLKTTGLVHIDPIKLARFGSNVNLTTITMISDNPLQTTVRNFSCVFHIL